MTDDQADLRRHRALVDDVNQQAITMGLSNYERINRPTATVGQ